MKIHFEKAKIKYHSAILNWLDEPHIKEFWDNSQEHKSDILNFIEGRKTPSPYFDGLYSYWIGLSDDVPYCLVMTLEEKKEYDIPEIKKAHLSKVGSTYSLDFMIGDKNHYGKGLGALTLNTFIDFFRKNVDSSADTFFIDPDVTNEKAKHVYEKAGFKYIDDFIMGKDSVFSGQKTHFLVKRLPPSVSVIPATLDDFATIQNMAQFYIYDASRECEVLISNNGSYNVTNYQIYFQEEGRLAFLIKVEDELAGFVLLNQAGTNAKTKWNMGEFFILRKFQRKGIGTQVAHQIWNMYPAFWEVSVIPENNKALMFWRYVISSFTNGNYLEDKKLVTFDKSNPQRVIFSFDARCQNKEIKKKNAFI